MSLRTDSLNPLNANPEIWSNTLKQIVGKLPTICLSVFDHFMNLALKGLNFLAKIYRCYFHNAICCVTFLQVFSEMLTIKIYFIEKIVNNIIFVNIILVCRSVFFCAYGYQAAFW